ncbi:hypothetical protein GH714_007250 [Hevea brasiliensis]|uniref:Uncharacterized protein n=1 Tax=Hevea brasiliensis TaxID=3981 RepID=A0A6A6KK16_HEVBR|nr:hypothetical protein GH714_007250 [Hevea brasiliensis]
MFSVPRERRETENVKSSAKPHQSVQHLRGSILLFITMLVLPWLTCVLRVDVSKIKLSQTRWSIVSAVNVCSSHLGPLDLLVDDVKLAMQLFSSRVASIMFNDPATWCVICFHDDNVPSNIVNAIMGDVGD